MLIGPTITLGKLEQHMEDKVEDLRMELRKLNEEFLKLQSFVMSNPIKYESTDEQKKEFEENFHRLRHLEAIIKEKDEQMEWIKGKQEEAALDKEKARAITLTLKDCILLGIEH